MAKGEKTDSIESEMRREDFAQDVDQIIITQSSAVNNQPIADTNDDSDLPVSVNQYDEIVENQPEYRSAIDSVKDNLTAVKEFFRDRAATIGTNQVNEGLMEKISDESSDAAGKMPSFYKTITPGLQEESTDLLPTIGRGIRDRVVGAFGDYFRDKVTNNLSNNLRGWVKQQKASGSNDLIIQNLEETDLDLNVATFLPKILYSPTERTQTIRKQISSAMNRVMTSLGLFGDETLEK